MQCAEPICRDSIQRLLQECARKKDLKAGKKLFCLIANHGLDSVTDLHDYLIRMFASCGSLREANLIFLKVENPTLYTWNSIMSAHATLGDGKGTIALYYRLQEEGLKPSKFIFLSVLKSVSKLKILVEGRNVHSQILTRGLESDVVVGSSIIDMYGKCGSIFEASRVFQTLPNKNVVSWNAMIAGYVQQKVRTEAFDLFMSMEKAAIEPTKFTLSCILKACDSIEQCKKIHDKVLLSSLESDIVVGTALIDAYAKCEGLDQAQEVFDKLVHPDLACWNAIISGYAQHGYFSSALKLFEKMQDKVKPDKMTFSSVLKACAGVGSLKNGLIVYNQVIANNVESDSVLSNALIDMYAKCGNLEEAEKVLRLSSVRDNVSWNILISMYAMHGNCRSVWNCLKDMAKEGLKPDDRTFLSVLAACSHAGEVDEGREFFIFMVEEFGVVHGVEHLNCMIDLLGRAGHLKEAEVFLKTLPVNSSSSPGWTSLLSACNKYNNVKVGKQSFKKASLQDPVCGSGYILLSNICAGSAT